MADPKRHLAELTEREEKRAIRMAEFLSGAKAEEFMEDVAYLAGMEMESHLDTDTEIFQGIKRDGMKALYSKITRYKSTGNNLINN